MKFKLDENLPSSSAAILASAGHDVDTVTAEGLTGAPDQDVVAAATAAGRILIALDRGLGDIRSYPPGSHAGVVVLLVFGQDGSQVRSAEDEAAVKEFAPQGADEALADRVHPLHLHSSVCARRAPVGAAAGAAPNR